MPNEYPSGAAGSVAQDFALTRESTAAAARSVLPVGTTEQLADYLVNGYWEDLGAVWRRFRTVSDNQISVNLSDLNAEARTLARQALEAWEMVADLEFVETTGSADITFKQEDSDAWSESTTSGNRIYWSVVNVSEDWVDSYGTTVDSYSFSTFVHEIGHALGLGHLGPYNGNASYSSDAIFRNDSWHVSVMSYFSQWENIWEAADEAEVTTAMIADIWAIQQLYGTPEDSATAGNTTYGRGSNLGNYLGDLMRAQWDAADPDIYTPGTDITYTIWDESGIDTLDFSSDTHDQTIDLAPGASSTVLGVGGSLVIAWGTTIENVRAGKGNDVVLGNDADNFITGGGGNDTLEGGRGADDLWGGPGDDLLLGGEGKDTLHGGAGSDTLQGGSKGDRIYGGAGDDSILGGDGHDAIWGGAGDDRISGEAGRDRIHGGDGDDWIEGDLSNDSLWGDGGNDVLFGGRGDDLLYGGDGDDILHGGAHDDWLTGGAGADAFHFDLGGDVITDFEDDVDSIHISRGLLAEGATVADVIDLASLLGGDLVFDFGGGNVLTLLGVTNAGILSNDLFLV